MILSASRRTDIPSFHSDWFFDKLKAGEVLVPSPFIAGGKTAMIKLEPIKIEKNLLGGVEVSGTLEGIVFWTKNPAPMLARISELDGIAHYFQFTLNPYGEKFEANLPPLNVRIKTFVELSKKCTVIWRYDPIFVGGEITPDWHVRQFEYIAEKLAGSAKVCMSNTLIGRFKDIYCPNPAEVFKIAEGFAKIGARYGIEIKTCAEISNLERLGIKHGKCIDPDIFERLLNAKIKPNKKEGATRKNCLCMPCVDIGTYSTCRNGCVYCYADKGGAKPITAAPQSEVYERKLERVFEYV